MKAGCLDRMAFAKAALMQKALAAAGASPQSVAKAFKLQVINSFVIFYHDVIGEITFRDNTTIVIVNRNIGNKAG